ncbi:MAG: Spy/CpxP family protein refolding chaperone [Syntrophaceae bacterium]|nr:Spy/CpxP family protein refolding chaperone [Syntrophaceae bacterium]
MKKTMIALGLVTLILFGVTYAYAQGRGVGPGAKGGPCWESSNPGRWSTLTPEQRTKLQELRQRLNEETAQLRGAILTKRVELQSLWTNPKADPKAILDKEKELRDLQNQIREKVLQSKLEARKILSPEQIAEFGATCGLGPGFGRGSMMGYGHGKGYHGGGWGMWR